MVSVLRRLAQGLVYGAYPGRCNICGGVTLFIADSKNLRETLVCGRCGSYSRKRHMAKVLLDIYGNGTVKYLRDVSNARSFQDLHILNTGGGQIDNILRELPYYISSGYYPDVTPGAEVQGVRCEDLQRLTFPDNYFDLIISEDVMEHVRKPDLAWAEIRRVLKPSGYHIFTTPVDFSRQTTVYRIDTSGDEDIYLLPKVYHAGTFLVYSDFGRDILEQLKEAGMKVELDSREYAVICVKSSVVFKSQKV